MSPVVIAIRRSFENLFFSFMVHTRHRCANTSLGDVVSELLSALLNRLTELEQHEKELRVCHTFADEVRTSRLLLPTCPQVATVIKSNSIRSRTATHKSELDKLPSAMQLAQILCRIERKMAKQVGPEEFVQCSSSSHLNRKVRAKLRCIFHTFGNVFVLINSCGSIYCLNNKCVFLFAHLPNVWLACRVKSLINQLPRRAAVAAQRRRRTERRPHWIRKKRATWRATWTGRHDCERWLPTKCCW